MPLMNLERTVNTLVDRGHLSAGQADAWFADIARADEQGDFCIKMHTCRCVAHKL